MASNYPPGVSGTEPEIVGVEDEEYDVYQEFLKEMESPLTPLDRARMHCELSRAYLREGQRISALSCLDDLESDLDDIEEYGKREAK